MKNRYVFKSVLKPRAFIHNFFYSPNICLAIFPTLHTQHIFMLRGKIAIRQYIYALYVLCCSSCLTRCSSVYWLVSPLNMHTVFSYTAKMIELKNIESILYWLMILVNFYLEKEEVKMFFQEFSLLNVIRNDVFQFKV